MDRNVEGSETIEYLHTDSPRLCNDSFNGLDRLDANALDDSFAVLELINQIQY